MIGGDVLKSYEMKDTEENIVETLVSNSISRNEYLFRFMDMLNSIDESFTIALNGKWGTGKTFFVKQAKLLLEVESNHFDNSKSYTKIQNFDSWESHKKETGRDYSSVIPIYYDAWFNDNATDPVKSIVYEIIEQLELKEKIKSDVNLKNVAIDIFKSSVASYFEKRTGININDIYKDNEPIDYLTEIYNQKNLKKRINDFFDKVTEEKANRIVIFIDELDRCRPDYAVCLLERIKHYFLHRNITFVFSVNMDEFQYTIKKFYGEQFNATEYMDKFFDLTIDIPLMDVDRYFESICFNSGDLLELVCKIVIKKLDLSMRQVERFVKIIRIAIYGNSRYKAEKDFSKEKAVYFMMVNIAPLIIGLRLVDAERYSRFINGDDPKFLYEVYEGVNIDYLHTYCLKRGESFKSKNTNSIYVDPQKRLEELYNCIFNFVGTKQKGIGQMCFDKNSKEVLMNIVNLYSLQITF